MASREPHHVFTYDEYLARELETGLRHEFLEGAVYAMAGGTPEHARLITEVAFAIRSAVDPTRCRVFSSELKVQVAATGLATYPDVALVRGELVRASGDKNAVTNRDFVHRVASRGEQLVIAGVGLTQEVDTLYRAAL